MSFGEKVARIVTGKNKDEREQERQLKKEIMREQQRSYYEAKKLEATEIGKAKAKIEREAAIKRIRQNVAGGVSGGFKRSLTGYQSPVGFGISNQYSAAKRGFERMNWDPINGQMRTAAAPKKKRSRKRRTVVKRVVYRYR